MQRVDYPVIYIKVDGVEQAVNVDRCKPAHLIQPAKSDNDFLSISAKDPLWLSATKGGKLKALPNPEDKDALPRTMGEVVLPSETSRELRRSKRLQEKQQKGDEPSSL